jgi:hypothetical protein
MLYASPASSDHKSAAKGRRAFQNLRVEIEICQSHYG